MSAHTRAQFGSRTAAQLAHRLKAAQAIWHGRLRHTSAHRSSRANGAYVTYVTYVTIMVIVVAVVPILHVVWAGVTSAAGIALLSSELAPSVMSLVTAAMWAAALMIGRDLGPALLPPFPLHALAASALPRRLVLRRPVLRATFFVTITTTAACALVSAGLVSAGLVSAGLVSAGLNSQGPTNPLSAAAFIASGALLGVTTAVFWLIGQALPRASVFLALAVVAAAGAGTLIPQLQPFLPWAWFGSTYPALHPAPLAGALPIPLTSIGITVFTGALAALVPKLLASLRFAHLLGQSTRWSVATTHAYSVDLAAAASTFRRQPHLLRTTRAVRPLRSLHAQFLIRDFIGALRTPGRLATGLGALFAGGVLILLASVPTAPTALFSIVTAVAAGITIFASLGPLTDGVRHAASVAGDYPLYGVSDAKLLWLHTLFPLTAVIVSLLAPLMVALVSPLALGIGIGPSAALIATLTSALPLGVLSLIIRINGALKGPTPPAILTPVPTPMGDLSIVTQLTRALDGPILACLAGLAAAHAPHVPFLLLLLGLVIISVGIRRWRKRG